MLATQFLSKALASATKYPSIPNYHLLDAKQMASSALSVAFDNDTILTEKVDGTNTRILLFPDSSTLYGCRNRLTQTQSDVEGTHLVQELAQQWANLSPNHLTVVFLEIYGGQIGANAKEYTGKNRDLVGARIFDALRFDITTLETLLAKGAPALASWREHGGQSFLPEVELQTLSDRLKTPLTFRLHGSPPPISVNETSRWLQQCLPESYARLSEDGRGRPEGIVIRNSTRTKIAKARFENYPKPV